MIGWWRRKNYFEIPAFLTFEWGSWRVGNSKWPAWYLQFDLVKSWWECRLRRLSCFPFLTNGRWERLFLPPRGETPTQNNNWASRLGVTFTAADQITLLWSLEVVVWIFPLFNFLVQTSKRWGFQTYFFSSLPYF